MLDFLSGTFEDFIKILINGLFSIINGLIAFFLSPIITAINSLLSAFIYNYDTEILQFLSNVNVVISNVVVPNLIWVVNLFPPFTFQVMLLLLGLWLFIWAYEFSAGIIIRVIKLIKNVVPLA